MTVKRLVGFFVRGCLVLVPLGLTVYILFTILSWIDRLLPIGIPGAGLIITLTLVTLLYLACIPLSYRRYQQKLQEPIMHAPSGTVVEGLRGDDMPGEGDTKH